MAYIGVIKSAIDAGKTLIDKSTDIIKNNQEIISDNNKNIYELSCRCIDNYQKEILIIEEQINTKNLSDEKLDEYLKRISYINEKMEKFILDYTNYNKENTEVRTEENSKMLKATLGILTGGLSLVPSAVKKIKNNKEIKKLENKQKEIE